MFSQENADTILLIAFYLVLCTAVAAYSGWLRGSSTRPWAFIASLTISPALAFAMVNIAWVFGLGKGSK